MNTTPATAVFFEEAQEQCATLEALLLELNKNPHDDDALGAMFRSAHTIKGSSGLFGFDGIVDFTHVMENVLDRMRKHDLVASDSLIDLLLRCNDYLREVLREARQFHPREFRIVAAPKVVELFLDEESQHLAGLSDFIGKPISLQAEPALGQEQFDILLL